MRVHKTETTVYTFDELSDEAQQKAIEELWTTNVDFEWWDFIYEDAEHIGLKITEFDINRGSYCRGKFIGYITITARAIIKEHGEQCETHRDAKQFLENISTLPTDEYGDYEDEHAYIDLCSEFRRTILEDYRIILQKEYEYLTSEESIIDSIKANEYEFYKNGELYS